MTLSKLAFLKMSVASALVLAVTGLAHADRDVTGSSQLARLLARPGAIERCAPAANDHQRITQFGKCRCCGWENWGGRRVCVHQCCD